MSHALLLRLFLSPSYFSVHVALQYLALYHENIGITYYLTRRLEELPVEELRDVWGFICHLLVSRPSRSRALECLVVRLAEESTHLALFTLWYMQAYLRDFSPTASSTKAQAKSFTICQRVLHKCHEIIFEDFPGTSRGPYAALRVPSQLRIFQSRVKPNVEAAFVGIGCVLAGVPGMPVMTNVIGPVAIEQGRKEVDEEGRPARSVVGADGEGGSPRAIVKTEGTALEGSPEQTPEPDIEGEDEEYNLSPEPLPIFEEPARKKNKGALSLDAGLVNRHIILGARTSPALPLTSTHSPSFSDPFGQLDAPIVRSPTAPFASSPSISTSRRTTDAVGSISDALLQQVDAHAQRSLLQRHFCRTEIKFMLALESISNRLLVVPKPARVSALRAELTSLNHKLPAEVCVPMWCSSTDCTDSQHPTAASHHRIVRIPPGESVVLNSAERAPYLLLIEILHDDLDFDPSKRQNKDLLKKVVSNKHDYDQFSRDAHGSSLSRRTSRSYRQSTAPAALEDSTDDVGEATNDLFFSKDDAQQLTLSFSEPPEDNEEVDLVEQIYGDEGLDRQNLDITDSLVLPQPPKNKDLDVATWKASTPSSPALTPTVSQNGLSNGLSGLNTSIFNGSHSSVFDSPVMAEANGSRPLLSLDDYSERMRTAAIMLAQLNQNLVREPITSLILQATPALPQNPYQGLLSWLPGANRPSDPPPTQNPGPIHPTLSGRSNSNSNFNQPQSSNPRIKIQPADAAAIRERIMKEMLALEEERMAHMQGFADPDGAADIGTLSRSMKAAEDERIIRRELSKSDPSAVVFQESWAVKKSRIRQTSPYGHLASWDLVSVIVKTGSDLRQEQFAVQLIREFQHIWKEENCPCWVRYFRIMITGGTSGLIETITDTVSIHSLKKAVYARRISEGRLGQVTLMDHFVNTYGDPSSAKFARARRNFVKSLAGYSVVTYLLQIKDRHNGNILLDREGHLTHIDFGFMLSNSPGNIGFEAAPFKLPLEYVDLMGGMDSPGFEEFKRLFHEGFVAARKHCDRIITMVELMQKDSALPCFAALGDQTAQYLRDRFQPTMTQAAVHEFADRLIMSSLGSNWTRLYDSYQYYSQSIL